MSTLSARGASVGWRKSGPVPFFAAPIAHATHRSGRPSARDRSRKNKKNLHSIVSSTYIPPTPAKRTENRTPPATMQTGSRQGKGPLGAPPNAAESWGQATWRASPDVPCRHSWRHVFAGISSKPVSSRVSRPVTDKNKQKPATLSRSVTPAQPAPSTQTVENKNTKRRQRIRDAKNRWKHLESMTKHDIS